MYLKLLSALPSAAEVRSRHNKVVASNPKGKAIFGTGEDPFCAFQRENSADDIKKLALAYLQRTPFQMDLKQDEKLWRIRLEPMDKEMLLCADLSPEPFTFSQAAETQISLLQNIIQYINIPIYLTDISGEIIYINSCFSDLIGYTYDQILGQKITVFLDSPDLKSDTISEADIRLSTPQGICPFTLKQQLINTTTAPLFCGALYPVVTPQIQLSALEIPLPHIRIIADTQTVIQTNPLLLQALRLSQTPKTLQDIFTKESVETLLQYMLKVADHTDFDKPQELLTIQGQAYQAYASWTNSDKSQLDLYLIDITSRKNLEAQLLQTHKMEAMGQLTGGIAHDFNNILTAIMGFTDLLLQQHNSNDAAFADLMHIKGNVQKAAGLVGQLLTFSRKTPQQEHFVSIHDAFVDLSSLLQRAIAPNCHLKIEYKRHLGYVKMDTNQLTQIFLNFAVNAKDAMPKGGNLTISLAKEDIKKARSCGNDIIPVGSYVKITTADTGSGIAPNILPQIFDPFFTTKKKNNQSGTGLGLSTVYGLIHSAGGFIKVDSIPNVGTTFTVYLPRFEEKDTATQEPPTEIQNVFLPEPQAPILLVDDEEAIRTVTSRALMSKGFSITEAGSAEQALKILESKGPFQLIITDMVMPGLNGEQLITKIKQKHPDTPCLLMSGYSESFEKHTSGKQKDFDFIAKPFVLSDLLTKAKEILEKK